MGGYNGQVYNPRCKHGLSLYGRCLECDAERESREVEMLRSVNDPAQRIRDIITKRRRWFDGCGLCSAGGPDLVQTVRHDHDCPWLLTMQRAETQYALWRISKEAPLMFNAMPCGERAKP